VQLIVLFFHIPQLKIALDCGGCRGRQPPWVFLTHTHTDHSVDVPFMFRRREGSDVYCPKSSIDYINNFIRAEIELNSSGPLIMDLLPPSNLHGVEGGDKFYFGTKNAYQVTVIDCIHSVPCVGYCFDQKLTKLKEEYKDLPGKSLGELRRQGIEVSEEIYRPLFVYMGDTHYTVFEKYPELFNYPVIIVECTFYCEETLERANRDGHIHWSQLEPFVVSHPNTTFILIHFSCRYREVDIFQFFDGLTVREENPLSLSNVVLFVGDNNEGISTE